MPSNYKVKQITTTPATTLGEGPHWDIATQSLYFIDILQPQLPIHRYDYIENKTYSAKLVGFDGEPPRVSFIIPVEREPHRFVISMYRQLGIIEWNGKSPEAKLIQTIATIDREEHLGKNQINDAKVDPMGRLYFGSWKLDDFENLSPLGNLYRFDKGIVTKLKDKIIISNGLVWNVDKTKFYYIDSFKYCVYEYDYDPDTGDISNERVLIDLYNPDSKMSIPDGMTIDKDGFLYVAMFNASKVIKINPTTGKIDLEINLPTHQITSVAFGGPELDILYVTTASMKPNYEFSTDPAAGTLYTITGIGVGLPMNNVQL